MKKDKEGESTRQPRTKMSSNSNQKCTDLLKLLSILKKLFLRYKGYVATDTMGLLGKGKKKQYKPAAGKNFIQFKKYIHQVKLHSIWISVMHRHIIS